MSPLQPITIHKHPVEASGAKDNLVLGDHPGSSLVIPKALITTLWSHVREGIRSLTRGGLEVGGLLVGHKGSGGSVVIDELIPLPIEYRHGPAFHMSPADLATIAPAVKAVHRAGKLVVGFYRSRTRGDGMFRETDLAILEAIERAHASHDDDFRSCLVLAPKSLSLAIACVALRDKNGWTELPPATLQSNPVSIIAVSLPAEEKMRYTPVSISEVIPAATNRALDNRAAPIMPTPGRARLTPHGSRIEGVWWYGALGVVAAAALWLAFAQIERAPGPAPQETARAHLGFSATPTGPVWKLTWDPAAMDTLNPIGGVLSIDDGKYEQQVPLALPDLASGTLYYTPQQGGSLLFSLRIDRGGSHIEEHVRIIVAPVLEQTATSRDQKSSRQADAKSKKSTTARVQRSVKSFRIPVRQTSKAPTPSTALSAVQAPSSLENTPAQPPRPTVLTVAIPVPPPEARAQPAPAPQPQPAAPATGSSATSPIAPATLRVETRASAASTPAKSNYHPPTK